MFCSRLLGLPEHLMRVIMRDTGGGFGQKVMVQREDMCAHAGGAAGRRPGEVDRGPSREPDGRREVPHEHADATHRLRRRRLDPGHRHRLRVRLRRLPDAVAGGHLGRGRHALPRSLPGAGRRRSPRPAVYTNTVGRTAYRGPWQFETLAREVLLDIAARQMGIDPLELRRRNLLRRDELPFRNPNGMTYDSISPLETFEQAVAMLDYDAFRAEQAEARRAGRYLGVGLSTYVEPSTPGYGYYATEAATIRIEPSGKVNVYIAGGSTGNSIETTVVQLTADALGVRRSRTSTRSRATPRSPAFGAGTAGSRSGVDDRRCGARDGDRAPRAHRGHRRRTRSRRPPTTSSSPTAGPASAARRPSACRWPRSPALAYFEPAPPAARHPARSRGQRPVHRRRPPSDLGQRHPRVHLRGRRRRPARCSCCATS